MDGIIIINKQKGYTSHDVVNKIRKIYNTKKVGHTGTLDPNATGVLPILIGKATKLSEYLIEHDKTYIATLKLGEKTDTGDSEGNVIETQDVLSISQEKVMQILPTFLGEQFQTPPMYSAIKIEGKKLYEYAREGKTIELPKRKIHIYDIKLEKLEDSEIKFIVSCSKGTYIRSLCEDIAIRLGTVGYMKELTRVQVDRFSIENSCTLEELEKDNENTKLISIEEIFFDKDSIILQQEKLKLFLNGGRIRTNKLDGIIKIYDYKNVFIGTGIINNGILKRDIVIL